MLNQVVIVGRLVEEPTTLDLDNGHKFMRITVAVPRSYKNSDGEYDTDYVTCKLWDAIATNTNTYCHKGDTVGIRGRIETTPNENKEYKMEIIAEKITFLNANPNNKEA